MDDGHFLVGAEGGLAVTQDALGERGRVAELLVEVVIVASGLVAVIYLGHHAAVSGHSGTALAFLVADGGVVARTGFGTPSAAVVVATGTSVVTPSVVVTTRAFLAVALTHLVVVALAALAGTETLVADVFAALAHLVVLAVEDDVLQQFAVQSAVVELVAHRRLETHLEIQFLIIADEPHVIALEGVLELVTHVAVERLDVLDVEAFTIGWVADERTTGRHFLDVVDVAALEFDVLVQTGVLDVGAGDSDGLALDVAAIDLVGELTFTAVVVVDIVKQVCIIVGPLLESVAVAVHAGSDVGGDKGCLDEEGARAAHWIHQVGLALPPAEQDDAGCQRLVDGRIGLCHAPAALEQGLATAVE